ncbi:MAG: FG-GAP repeat domain-containing protein [Planctomycetota bacterium]
MRTRKWIGSWCSAASFALAASSALAAQRASFDSNRWWPSQFRGGIAQSKYFEGFVDLGVDGSLEIVTSAFSTPRVPGTHVEVGLNDGSGHYAGRVLSPFPSNAPWLMWVGSDLGDLNCDGLTDFLLRGWYQNLAPIRLYAHVGDGSGSLIATGAVTFAPEPTWDWLHPSEYLVLVADLNGDGADDVMVGKADASVAVYRNDGAGHFQELAGALVDTQAGDNRARLADLDRDSDLDLVTSHGSIFWNRGDGHFLPGPRVRGGRYSVAAGDLDGDGWADLVFGSNSIRPILFLNDRMGGFVDESARITPVSSTAVVQRDAVQIVDVNGDGRMDINFFSRAVPWATELYVQDAAGQFADGKARVGLAGAPPELVTCYADMDRDGDVDAVLYPFLNTPGRVYPNLHRQIMTNDPHIGGQLDVDLFAPVGHLVNFALSLGRLDANVPPFGWWALDPSTTAIWPTGALVPSSGSVQVSMPVPNQAALVGLRLFAQGIDIDLASSSVRLMNFWPITIR